MYGTQVQTAIAFAMNEDFGGILQQQMNYYNSSQADSVADVRSKLDAVRDVMVQNIESVLERGEKLELMVDKTVKLQNTAFTFERSSRRLKNALFWRRVRFWSVGLLIFALVVWLISVSVCGADDCCGEGTW